MSGRSSWSGRPRPSLRLPAGGYAALAAYPWRKRRVINNAAFREAVLGEENAAGHLWRRVSRTRPSMNSCTGAWGAAMSVSPISAITPIPAALPIWACLPDLLPGYVPVSAAGAFAQEYPGMPATPGMTQPQMLSAAADGNLARCWSLAQIPWQDSSVDQAALKNTFVIVQDLFLTETAAVADVVFPAASLYEKTGTVTNTFGDLQLVRKAADNAGVKPDFEILVRLAAQHGRGCEDAGALRQRRRARRSGPVARRAIRRGRPARRLARCEWPGTEAEPVRSVGRFSTRSNAWCPATSSIA